MDELVVMLKNDLTELGRLARVIEEFGERNHWPVKIIYGVNLSLDELVTNIISYAYTDAAEHQIALRVAFEQPRLTVVLEDDGRPFNPLEAPQPDLAIPVEEREIGGLGIFLVRKTMDHLEYSRRENKNILVMTKTI